MKRPGTRSGLFLPAQKERNPPRSFAPRQDVEYFFSQTPRAFAGLLSLRGNSCKVVSLRQEVKVSLAVSLGLPFGRDQAEILRFNRIERSRSGLRKQRNSRINMYGILCYEGESAGDRAS